MASQGQGEHLGIIRYILLATILVLLLAIFLFWRIDNARAERFRLALLNQIVPNVTFLTSPVKSVGRMVTGMTSYTNVYKQNKRLQLELNEMKKWREAALQLEQKNAKLRALNNLKLSPSLLWITGEIIADSGSPFNSSILINLGTDDGVLDGAAVADGLGLVGRISGVEKKLSRVILLSDIKSFVPAMIEPNNQEAIVRGNNSSVPSIAFIRGTSKIQPGSRIYTSGRGGIFPAGILIGKAILSPEKKIKTRLAANLNQLDYVRVIINRNLKIPAKAGSIIKNYEIQ
jgi:rod shape-determining protein MreC